MVSAALEERVQRSRDILQVWEVFGRLAASSSKRLQMLQSDAESALSGAAADESTVEQLDGRIRNVQVRRMKTKI